VADAPEADMAGADTAEEAADDVIDVTEADT
jgi:hypothetical protein